jgi:exopolysaccharide production protein ExoZ
MFFYVLFACSLVLSVRIRLLTLSAVFIGLVLAGYLVVLDSPVWLTYTGPLLLEFLAGAWIGQQCMEREGQPRRATHTAAELGAIVLALTAVGQVLPRLEHAWLAALLVIAGILLERAGKMPKIVAPKLVGDASYSIYLFQHFAFGTADRVMSLAARLTHMRLDAGPTRIPVEFFGAIALGFAAFYCLERPLSAYARTALAKIVPQPGRLASTATT